MKIIFCYIYTKYFIIVLPSKAAVVASRPKKKKTEVFMVKDKKAEKIDSRNNVFRTLIS